MTEMTSPEILQLVGSIIFLEVLYFLPFLDLVCFQGDSAEQQSLNFIVISDYR